MQERMNLQNRRLSPVGRFHDRYVPPNFLGYPGNINRYVTGYKMRDSDMPTIPSAFTPSPSDIEDNHE
jgi:hypothetical protein